MNQDLNPIDQSTPDSLSRDLSPQLRQLVEDISRARAATLQPAILIKLVVAYVAPPKD